MKSIITALVAVSGLATICAVLHWSAPAGMACAIVGVFITFRFLDYKKFN